ncbi:MAG: four helix bundle protein [Elusimicrobia bacterium]|nr:four helix bundle protein [Elusimicrobiota bacterium]
MAKTFKDLIVWKEAKLLVHSIYRQTSGFPKEETYGLISQMRRAALSVPSNIAEGWGSHSTDKQFLQYLNNASGSLAELESHIAIAADEGFLASAHKNQLEDQVKRISYLINRFRDRLN